MEEVRSETFFIIYFSNCILKQERSISFISSSLNGFPGGCPLQKALFPGLFYFQEQLNFKTWKFLLVISFHLPITIVIDYLYAFPRTNFQILRINIAKMTKFQYQLHTIYRRRKNSKKLNKSLSLMDYKVVLNHHHLYLVLVRTLMNGLVSWI